MIQGQEYLVFILDQQERFYYTDQYGEVRLSSSPKPIKITPDGWQEISILNERNKRYWGLDRSFTIPLKWVADGAKIIKTLYYNGGAQAACTVLILEQYLWITGSEYDYRYRTLYKGEPDLTTFNHEGAVVTVNCIEGGLAKLLKADENTTYEIPCEGVNVKHDGLNLEANSTFIQTEQTIIAYPPIPLFGNFQYWTWWLSIQFVNNEGTIFDTEQQSISPVPNDRKRGSNSQLDDNYFTDAWFFKAGSNVTVNVRRPLRIQVKDFLRFRYYIKTSTGRRIMLVDLVGNNSPAGQTVNVNIMVNEVITLSPDETLTFISEIQDAPARNVEANATFYEDQVFISYTSRYKTTTVPCITLYNLFATLVQKITGGAYGFQSSILTGSKVVVTCGDALRGIAESKVKTSISQAFDATTLIPGIGPVGMGIVDGKLTIEPLSYWLKGEVIDLGKVTGFRDYSAADFLYNQINVGYSKQDYDNLNGKDEFNATLQFTTNNKSSSKALDLLSPWRADPYGIEDVRINLAGKTTTDAGSDNDVFLLATDGAGNLDRSLNSGAIGIIDPNGIYNIGLSPKRILLSYGAFIRSFMRGQDGTWIKYQTAEKNPRLVAAGVAETGDELISSLPDPIFIPDFHEFECPVPDDYAGLIAANPIRRFRYTYEGVTMTGIAFRSGIQPGLAGVQQFQCLSDVSNVPVKQIDIDA